MTLSVRGGFLAWTLWMSLFGAPWAALAQVATELPKKDAPPATETTQATAAADPAPKAESPAKPESAAKPENAPKTETGAESKTTAESKTPADSQKPKKTSKKSGDTAQSETKDSSTSDTKPARRVYVGIDGGFSGDFLVSNTQTGAFGSGIGSQYGVSASLFAEKKIGLKIRVERLDFEEQIYGDKATESLLANSYLKSAQQNYWAISLGAEWRSEGFFGRQFFWETGLGYAVGQPSQYTLLVKQVSDELHFRHINPENSVFVNLGAGFRREFRDRWNVVFVLRTVLLTKTVYGAPFTDEFYVPVPFMLSIGIERAF
ncbi:MAG TPA: hypothetical protein VFV50_10670 [Bdellovibrionales bacterium]|nr:hypothetical protein [Bdellovibrionales bacterium]